jgi:dihydrofolate reductase
LDEIIISTIPVILGAGTKLFKEGIPERALQLLGSKSFSSGLIQAHYKLI